MKNVLIIAIVALLSGCSSISGYTPVVDTYGDRNAANLQYDMAQCEAIAKQTSSVGSNSLQQGGVGALIGGAGGAALGAIVGNPALGAAAGATVGGIGGAAKGGFESDAQYKRVFNNCLRNRGHAVLN